LIAESKKIRIAEGLLLDENVENNLAQLTGKYYSLFVSAFNITIDNSEKYAAQNLTVYEGYVKGLKSLFEGIVVTGVHGEIWAAVTDPEEDKVYYFSNVQKTRYETPAPLLDWLRGFPRHSVVYHLAR